MSEWEERASELKSYVTGLNLPPTQQAEILDRAAYLCMAAVRQITADAMEIVKTVFYDAHKGPAA